MLASIDSNTQVPPNREPSIALGRHLGRRPLRVLCWVSAPVGRLYFLHGQHCVISASSGSPDTLKAMRGLVVSGVHMSRIHAPSHKHASHPLTGHRAPAKRQCMAVHHVPACWFVYDRGCVALGGDRKRRSAYDGSLTLQQRESYNALPARASCDEFASPACRRAKLSCLGADWLLHVSKAALNTLLPTRTTQKLTCLHHH